jgi:ACS family hexuronate transporter-like MFS transporter
MENQIGKYRWTICALLFFATTINYLDRTVIGLVREYLDVEFGWNNTDYANITVAFQLAYAFGMVGAGRIVDFLGTKSGYALSLVTWSAAAIGHYFVNSTVGFYIARAALGVTESGNFPSAIKATAEWFPKKERALATGIFNSGTNVGAIIAPLTVPFLAESFGWRMAFVITGAIGLVWLVFWYIFYEVPAKQTRLGEAEYKYIHSDLPEQTTENTNEAPITSTQILGFKQTWAFILGKFMTDGVWWFYLFWLPGFLKDQYKLAKTDIALPLALVYTLASVGSVLGGWLPMHLIKNGMPVFKARKTAMLIYAACALPVVFAQVMGGMNMWFAIIFIGFAAAAHQAWSANIFTTVSDMFPKRAIGSVIGIGGMAGGLGGILISKSAGYLFDHYKALGHIETGYYLMFFFCGCAYLLAWGIMHLLTPRMEEVKI